MQNEEAYQTLLLTATEQIKATNDINTITNIISGLSKLTEAASNLPPRLSNNPSQIANKPNKNSPQEDKDAYLSRYVYIIADDMFVDTATGNWIKRGPFNEAMGKFKPPSLRMTPSKYLIDELEVPTVQQRLFDPTVEELIFSRDGVEYFNLYDSRKLPEVPKNWDEDRKVSTLLEQFFYTTIKEPDYARLVMQWIAHNIQFPGKRIAWSPLEIGGEGSGKTTKGKLVAACFNNNYVGTIDNGDLASGNTGWAEGNVVNILEEIKPVGENRHKVVNALKPYITNDTIRIKEKYLVSKDAPNKTNYIAFSNYEDALALSDGERRWLVYNSAWSSNQEVKANTTKEWWNSIQDLIKNHKGAIRGFFLNIDLSDFDPDWLPDIASHSAAKANMISSAKSDLENILEEVIEFRENYWGIEEGVLLGDQVKYAMEDIQRNSYNANRVGNILRHMGYNRCSSRPKIGGIARGVYLTENMQVEVDKLVREGSSLSQVISDIVGPMENAFSYSS